MVPFKLQEHNVEITAYSHTFFFFALQAKIASIPGCHHLKDIKGLMLPKRTNYSQAILPHCQGNLVNVSNRSGRGLLLRTYWFCILEFLMDLQTHDNLIGK